MEGYFEISLDISGTEAGYTELWKVNISRIFRVACELIVQSKYFVLAVFLEQSSNKVYKLWNAC